MSHFAIAINGKPMLKSDEKTTSIIFNNLSGRNYNQRPGEPMPTALLSGSHDSYLAAMSHEFKINLSPGDSLVLLKPDGTVARSSSVGGEFKLDEDTAMQRERERG